MKASDVTDDQFADALEQLVDEMSAGDLFAIPGVYEALSEALNNEALKLAMENTEPESAEG